MDNVNFVVIDDKEYAIIDHGNEAFTSMPKLEYERQQAEQSTPIVTADE
jgi:hypothetical protein